MGDILPASLAAPAPSPNPQDPSQRSRSPLKTPKTAAENTGVTTRIPRATRGKGRPKQEDSEETLRTVYHVAYSHFIVNGIEGASMQAIAREAGVSRQMIHNRFGNKEQIFRTVLVNGEDILDNSYSVNALPISRVLRGALATPMQL